MAVLSSFFSSSNQSYKSQVLGIYNVGYYSQIITVTRKFPVRSSWCSDKRRGCVCNYSPPLLSITAIWSPYQNDVTFMQHYLLIEHYTHQLGQQKRDIQETIAFLYRGYATRSKSQNSWSDFLSLNLTIWVKVTFWIGVKNFLDFECWTL